MAHSRLAASASSRWLLCRGSVAYIEHLKDEKRIPRESSNVQAELGTAVHSLVEEAIIKQKHPQIFNKHEIAKLTKIPLDARAIEGATIAFEWAQSLRDDFDEFEAERQYNLTYRYGIDMGGTSDISGFKKRGTLLIGDYKNGRSPVEVEKNSQMRIYTLGAYHHENEWYNFKKIHNTIIQPNASHPDGKIRHELYSIKELLTWEENTLIPAIEDIKRNTAKLTPGPVQCAWCEARYLCEANAKQTMQLAQIDFENLAEPKPTLPMPGTMSKKQLAFILDNADRIKKFLKACEDYAYESVQHGSPVGDYTLIDSFGNRVFIEKALTRLLRRHKIDAKSVMLTPEPQLMSVTQLEAHLKSALTWSPSKVKEFMDDVTDRPISGKKLVKSKSSAENDFGKITK